MCIRDSTKTIQFFDINYQLAQADDKAQIFENYCDFLNYFDSTINVQLTFICLLYTSRQNITAPRVRAACRSLLGEKVCYAGHGRHADGNGRKPRRDR